MRKILLIGCLSLLVQLGLAQVVHFIENKGQWPSQVKYSAATENGRTFFENNAFTHHFFDLSEIAKAHAGKEFEPVMRGHVFRQVFRNAHPEKVTADAFQQTRYNYFLGNDPLKWGRDCREAKGFRYQNFYSGIHLHVYQNDFFMKYDWELQRGASPAQIQWTYEGTDDVRVEDGRLIVRTALGEIVEQIPIAYQMIPMEGEAAGNNPPWKTRVECAFVKNGNTISFRVGKYNPRYALIIDPELIFSSYSGSFDDNFGYTATYDSQGNLISGSSAFGQGYPTTIGAYQTTWGGGDGQGSLAGTDMAISKYDALGTFLQWSTFLGGANDDLPHSLICNSNDELIVLGTTSSGNFPVTSNAFDNSFNGGANFAPFGVGVQYVNGSDIIVAKLNVNGNTLEASTFVGGTGNDGVNTAAGLKFNYADEFRGEVDLDANDNVYVVSSTYSTNFPTVNAFQSSIGGLQDACVFQLSSDLSQMNWSTYLGGSDDDSGFSLAEDNAGNVFVCGGTQSVDFPLAGNGYGQVFNGGNSDGWIAKLNPSGASLLTSTYFGSNVFDQLYFIETDNVDDVFVYGQTRAANSTFVVNAAFSQPNSGMLVTKFPNDLSSIVWSTVFGTGGGEPNLSPTAFLVDVCGKIYLSGWGGAVNEYSTMEAGYTTGLITTPDAFQTTTDGSDFYLLVLEADASAVTYASFFGGNISAEHVDGGTSRFDRKGIIYQSVCAGCGGNSDFPIFPPNAVSAINNNSCNNGVFKYDFQLPLTVANFNAPPFLCEGSTIQLVSTSSLAASVQWHFSDDNSTVFGNSVVHTFNTPGTYTITLTAQNPNTCNAVDTISRTITVVAPIVETLADVTVCSGIPVQLGQVSADPNAVYTWTPNDGNLSDVNGPLPIFTGSSNASYQLLVQHDVCTDTLTQNVVVPQLELTLPNDTSLCVPDNVDLNALVSPSTGDLIWSASPDFSNPLNTNFQDLSINVFVNGMQTYFAQLTSQGCTVEDSVSVFMVGDQATIQGDFTACYGDTVSLSVLNPNPTFNYQWQSNAQLLSGQGTSSVEFIITAGTTVSVSAATPSGCFAQDTVQVAVSALNASTIDASATPAVVLVGTNVQLNASPINAGYNYVWTPNIGLSNANIHNPNAFVETTTTYNVAVSDGDCIQQDSVTVRVVDFICGRPTVYVPNAFTPNLDQANDWLYVRGNFITELNFKVFDRWGELVFETQDQSIGWNGYYKGKKVDPAVFVYYLRTVCEGGEIYFEEGNITVLE
ncbi:MAG: gliding motility-associated C-terminal domain-containing protein [Flavobacteriales bacterium]|nr:gliding motility-associated C-terminal domain-containing protein [Flavobacteriales bacterium]MDP4817775.1 gliding motility-associated C-terminal domain-containing protein [Flavobacteriales bacterium]MDP4950535.1 gliding motility-associated C-terminal domain-containing protein [Flavobacteriales bacterium]